MRRKPLLITLGVVVVGALVAVNLLRDFERAESVDIEKVKRRDLRSVVSASGWLRAHRKVDVSANTMGKVVELRVREGDQVELGDVLLRIDPVRYRGEVDQILAALRRARADLEADQAVLEEARDNLNRERQLRERGLSSQNELDTKRRAVIRAEAGIAADNAEIGRQEAALTTAQHNLDQVTVVAEMSGVITRLDVEEGENVVTGTMNNPGTVLMTVADLSIMEVRLEVDETDIVDLVPGMHADVRVDAFPDTTFGAVVTEIGHAPIRRSGRAGESSADFEVIVRLVETSPAFRPGLSAAADVVTAERQDALAVSIGALVYRDPAREERRAERRSGANVAEPTDEDESEDTYGVFVIDGGAASFRPVEIGITGERHFEIVRGLEEGDELVAGPFRILRNLESGDRVKRQKRLGS